jgi:transcriptional regulator with XRE-family HTH domain
MKRRVDAALRYAGMSQGDLEEKTSLSRSTLYRRRSDGDIEFTKGELFEIADVTKVPPWFLLEGWQGWRKELSVKEIQELIDSLPPVGPPSD